MNTQEIREANVWELVDGTLMMSLPKDKVIALCDAADELTRLRADNAMLVEALEKLEEKLAGNMRHVRVGDRVKVIYKDGGGCLEGIVTRIWRPSEHRAGIWQGQVNDGWCFHAKDEISVLEEAEELAEAQQ